MKRQNEMVDSFLMAHREFMKSLEKSLALIEEEINKAGEIEAICTGEWCRATESTLDELAKFIYSISEPRWVPDKDSKTLFELVPVQKWPFHPNSASCSKNNARNINYMPVLIFFAALDFERNCSFLDRHELRRKIHDLYAKYKSIRG